jgi:hypothetical protein
MNQDTGILFGWYKICKTIDGGESWYQVGFEQDEDVNPSLTYHFCNDGTGYLYLQGLNSSLFKTEDYGDSWFEIEKPTTSVINTINFFSSDQGIIAGEDGIIFKTQTGGMVSLPEWKHEKDQQLLIYPNPSRGSFSIDIPKGSENGMFYLYDLHGKLIDKHAYHQSGKQSGIINLSRGIYIIKIESGKSSISGKLIVI